MKELRKIFKSESRKDSHVASGQERAQNHRTEELSKIKEISIVRTIRRKGDQRKRIES
uniref:Uncharacterized protein n=1 Tax=Utricularia reniformis TaxID=192314 RepID=A0A1Y0B4T4_9LAMI|nr:hypothetical protein AEK19_MT2256 [Utricularia reniformis]ART32400.1 hypothetical protein AEK19_MT2256 [Utricularia reniformis]